MKILVTGANGYLGLGIVQKLIEDGMDVIAVDFSVEDVDKRAKRYAVDFFKIEDPYNYFGCPDVILHLAWRDGFKHNSDAHLEDLYAHYIFLKELMDSGIKRVCVLGSMHEVGFFEGSINENTPTKPESLYGISKDALRNAIRLYAEQKSTIFQWIRGYYIVGNTTRGCSIFSKIMQASSEGKTEFPFTLGLNQYDFIDYDEFCYQVASVVEQQNINGIINCCSGRPMRLAEKVESFIKDNNLNITLQYGAFPDRPYDSKAVWGDNKKIIEIMKDRTRQDNV